MTIENPKGSVRSGVDADGKEWSSTMNNTYGYFRGTTGKDGDHIDVFIGEETNPVEIYVIDQLNPNTGKFDEHKVMYGFTSEEEAKAAYLSNYEEGWKGLGAITPVTKEEFYKWVDSSKRKIKPFSKYSSVKIDGDVQVEDIEYKPIGIGVFGNIYDQFKGRVQEAIEFLKKNKDGEAIGALYHKDIGEIDLIWGKEGSSKSDGYGLSKLIKYHPEVVDNLQEIISEMVITNRSDNRINLESEKYQAVVRLTWDDKQKTWLLTAFEKKNSVLDNTTDTVETPKSNGNDTATSENTVSASKDTKDFNKAKYLVDKVVKRLGIKINVVEDVNDLPQTEKTAIDAIKSGAPVKGWFNPKTGQSYIYAPNARDESDVEKTILHEIIAHQGLRELLGKDKFNELCDAVWHSMSEENKAKYIRYIARKDLGITEMAEHLSSIQYQREAADEYMAFISENGLDDQTVWDKIKEYVREFLKSLGFSTNITDEDIVNLLRASRSNLQKSNEVRKNDENTIFRFANSPKDFDALQKEAVEKKGIVAPNLNSMEVEVVNVPKHDFKGTGLDAIHKAEKWANENLVKEHTYHEGNNDEFKYSIDDDAISKFLSKSSTTSSDNLGIHLAVLKRLPYVIDHSIDAEVHPDYKKINGVRSSINGVDRDDLLVHRLYGAVEINGKMYRAKTTIHEIRNTENKAYDYKITEVKLIISGSSSSDALNNPTSIEVANLLKGVEKSYDKGKKLLDESVDSGFISDKDGHIRMRTVYHGSPYDFEKFLLDKIGTGEGAQAFGRGIYTTEVENIARSYAGESALDIGFNKDTALLFDRVGADRVARTVEKILKRQGYNTKKSLNNINYDRLYNDVLEELTINKIAKEQDVKEAELAVKEHVATERQVSLAKSDLRTAQRAVDYFLDKQFEDIRFDFTERNLYTVEIPDNDGTNYLSWGKQYMSNKKIEEQLAAENLGAINIKGLTGNEIYFALERLLGSDKAASEFLNRAGFVGVVYPAQATTGGRSDNANNYVLFNENDLEITDHVRFRISNEVENLFDEAVNGNLKGKPVSVGKLTQDGKKYLESISGLKLKDDIDFVLNPSDLVHIYDDHFGKNEKDKGNNIPLTKHDIRRMVDVISFPTNVVFGKDDRDRNLFYFLMGSPSGTYNLLEIYADRKGNLTTKTYYKTKKGVSQRVMEIEKSLLPTSETYSGTTLSSANIPQMFDNPNIEGENLRFRTTPEEQRVVNAAVDKMLDMAGVKVVREKEDAPVPENVRLSKKQKALLDTGIEDDSSLKVPAISINAGTKILTDIDRTIETYKNSDNSTRTFIGDVADALGIEMPDRKSKYAKFEAKNGTVFTIRISDHNATVSNFDNHNETNGVSIIISRKPNNGISNDGNAHIAEYFYSDKAINKADGKPLVEILQSIKQSLYNGEYTDTTGLAEVEEVNVPSKAQYWITNRRSTERWENSGYTYREDGTRVSNRALEAEKRGSFTAGTFRKVYGLTKADFDILVDLGLINNTEWHHTGKSFRESDYYSWADSMKSDGNVEYEYKNGRLTADRWDTSLAKKYIDNKKELKKLAKEYADGQWEYRSKQKTQDVSTIDEFVRKKIYKPNSEYLTEQERNEKDSRHNTISTVYAESGMSSRDRYEKHTEVDRQYDEIANERRNKEIEDSKSKYEKEYNDTYGESIRKNAEIEKQNAEVEEYNSKQTTGKEVAMIKIGELMGLTKDEATRKSSDTSIKEFKKSEEANKKKEIEEYNKSVDERIAEKQSEIRKFVNDNIANGNIKEQSRLSKEPTYFVTTLEEMNGKYGWFEAKNRYNLPVYYTGLEFKYKETYDKYQALKSELYKPEYQKRYLSTDKGEIYGYVQNGIIHLYSKGLNPNTKIHEYTHLWDAAVEQKNPELWKRGVELMKQTGVWRDVVNDKNYSDLTTDSEIASEVHARLTGKDGAALLDKLYKEAQEKTKGKPLSEQLQATGLINNLKSWVKQFWTYVKDTFTGWTKAEADKVTLDDFVNMPLADLAKGVKLPTHESNAKTELAEEQSIKDTAKANGAYMKAPNGKDTNLTPKQWLQVRTKAFKKWFGDWEKAARIEKLRNSTTVINKFNNEFELNRDSAKEWINKNIRGEYVNKDTNAKIIVSRVGVNEVTAHGERDIAHLKSLISIPDLIENSIFVDEIDNEKGDNKYDSYRYYISGIKIDGEDYTAKVVVGVKGGSKYYDHRLTKIEKGALINSLNELSNSVAENQNTLFDIKDKRLLSLLQTNSSKVVDENGEPMVVYHGTTKFGFTVFDNEMSDDSISIFTSPNVNIARGYAGILANVKSLNATNEPITKDAIIERLFNGIDAPMDGYDAANILAYLQSDLEFIADFDEDTEELKLSSSYSGDITTINKDEYNWNDVIDWVRYNANLNNLFDTYSGIYALYVNAKNVLTVDAGETMWSYIPKKSVKGMGGEGMTSTRDIAKFAKDNGYDGIFIKNLVDAGNQGYGLQGDEIGDVFISLNDKSSIKSATDNNGDFSSENDDIRFKLSTEEQSIKEAAKANGTYMKAPNGKPTKLSEEQWLQVRTKAFKKWFGDWEKAARIEKLRNSKPIEITGNEVTPSDDLKVYKKNALEYGKTLRGEYTNKDTRTKVEINAQSVKEVLHHDYKNKEQLQSVAAIPQIIEQGIYIDTSPNEDTDTNSKVKEYQYYVTGLKIGDIDYTVKSVIAVDNNGNRYYDHTLTKIEKGNILKELDRITSPSSQENTALSVNKDKRLLSLLQTNSSKVVDENGEPMVVYHGTTKFGFTKFDKESSDDGTRFRISTGNEEIDNMLGKSLYRINKEAKRYRDLKSEYYNNYHNVTENVMNELERLGKITNSFEVFFKDDGSPFVYSSYMDEFSFNDREENKNIITDQEVEVLATEKEIEENTSLSEKEIKELRDNLDFEKEVLDEYNAIVDYIDEIDDIDVFGVFDEEIHKFYGMKNKVLEKLVGTDEKALSDGIHSFPRGDVRRLYQLGDYSFHGRDISSEDIEDAEAAIISDIEEISADNKLAKDISIDEAISNVKVFLSNDDIRFKLSTEEQSIKDDAKANGTYMKAPNGKPTKLNARQWLQVRTKAFKKWFGDWELSNKLKLIEDLESINLDKNKEISDKKTAEDIAANLDNGKNEYDNRSVRFVKSTIGKLLKHQGFDCSLLIPDLKTLFDTSVPAFFEKEERKAGHKDHSSNIIGYHHYINKIEYGGVEYYVRFTAQEVKTRSANYIPNELHSAHVTDIEIYNADTFVISGTIPTTKSNDVKIDTKLQQFFKEAREAQTNSSKVVDENGEPKPVYHNTDEKRTIFDKNKARKGQEIQAFFFAPNSDPYKEYGPIENQCFLNIRKPADHKTAYNGFNERLAYNTNAGELQREELMKNGFDGGILNEDNNVYEYFVFESNQIKSATDNNGDFSSENDDIRFRFIGEKGAAAFDKAQEATTRLDNLQVARDMEGSKKKAKAIKLATGWERGADGKWRYEVEDSYRKGILEFKKENNGYEGQTKLDALLGPDNKLFKEYPQLKDVFVSFVRGESNISGTFSHNEIILYLNTLPEVEIPSVLAHEIQHAIQGIEGFARGGSPGGDALSTIFERQEAAFKAFGYKGPVDFDKRTFMPMLSHLYKAAVESGNDKLADKIINEEYYDLTEDELSSIRKGNKDAGSAIQEAADVKELNRKINDYYEHETSDIKVKSYHNLAGEVEARNAARRTDMFQYERSGSLATETEDVDRKDQLIRHGLPGIESSIVSSLRDQEEVAKFAQKLNLRVNFVDSEQMPKGHEKGFYNAKNGEISICLENNNSKEDAIVTIIHEGVRNIGLRKLFGDDFDGFLKQVFSNVDEEARGVIVGLARRKGWTNTGSFEEATEEYLSQLAEKVGFNERERSVWEKVKDSFRKMIEESTNFNRPLKDNELRYILIRNYDNLTDYGPIGGIFDSSRDIQLRKRLGIGRMTETEADIQFRKETEAVNDKFNVELQQQIDGTLPKGHTYQLGMPSNILRSAGIENLPIELQASRLVDKSMQENHPFDLSEVKDLPRAIQKPLAVFRSATHIGSSVLFTELRQNNKNFVVAVSVNKNKERIEVNQIRSLYPKNGTAVSEWINEGLLEYTDKKRMSEWLSQPQSNSVEVRESFRHATKIVQEFKNPIIESENLRFRKEVRREVDGNVVNFAAQSYDSRLNETITKLAEQYQDSMISLKILQEEMAKESGKEIQEFENAYMAENHKSSKDLAEKEYYFNNFYKPMMMSVHELQRKCNATYEDVKKYIIAKSGLERNEKAAIDISCQNGVVALWGFCIEERMCNFIGTT